MIKKIRYVLEGIVFSFFFTLFKLLPLDTASALGGFIARKVGPHLSATKKAQRNLRLALPDLDSRARQTIIRDMWDNLGRVMAEYPHLEQIAKERVTFHNGEILRDIIHDRTGSVFIGLHQANWEIFAASALLLYDFPLDITYRAPNNPAVDRIILKARSLNGRIAAHPKTRKSGQIILNLVKNKGNLAILIDQKYNPGPLVPFFGYPAKTNPVAFQIAQKYGAPLIPGRCVRTKGAHFEIALNNPIPTQDETGQPIPIETLMAQAHGIMEGWIREYPGQWLWLHQRWGKRLAEYEQQKDMIKDQAA